MSKFAVTLFIILLSFSAKILAVGNPDDGKIKSAVCVACHGVDGNATTPIWPKIAGQNEAYLLKELEAFKVGQGGPRYDPTMYGIVQNLSQQDMEDLAAFFSTQQMTIGTANPDMLALGQALYRGGNIATGVPACAACHGADGKGNYLAKFPRLSGQNSAYVVAQLNNFKNKTRDNAMMNDIAARLTNEEIEAVANYVAGLH